jgi:hypothetical protein
MTETDVRTPDLGGSATTSAFASAIVDAIQQNRGTES